MKCSWKYLLECSLSKVLLFLHPSHAVVLKWLRRWWQCSQRQLCLLASLRHLKIFKLPGAIGHIAFQSSIVGCHVLQQLYSTIPRQIGEFPIHRSKSSLVLQAVHLTISLIITNTRLAGATIHLAVPEWMQSVYFVWGWWCLLMRGEK